MIGILMTLLRKMKVHEFHNFVNQDSELFRILRHLPRPDENGPWLAGGSVWKAIENIPLDCDIDFFFRDKDQLEEYLRKLKSIPYVYHIVTEKTNSYNTTFGFHIHENGYNKTVTVQYVSCRFCDSLEKLLSGFDFTACQFGFDGSHLISGDTSFEDLKNRIIRLNEFRASNATLIHLEKYLKRGFTVPPDEMKKIEALIKPSKPKTIDEIIWDGVEDDGYPIPEEPSSTLDGVLAAGPTPIPISIDPEPGLVYAPYVPSWASNKIVTTQWNGQIISNANTSISNTTSSW